MNDSKPTRPVAAQNLPLDQAHRLKRPELLASEAQAAPTSDEQQTQAADAAEPTPMSQEAAPVPETSPAAEAARTGADGGGSFTMIGAGALGVLGLAAAAAGGGGGSKPSSTSAIEMPKPVVPKPDHPLKPIDPTTPDHPATPVDPTTPDHPVTPVEPTTPVQPVTPTEPTTPVQPVTPVGPTTPDHPVTPVEPTTPVQPVTPTEPTTPVQPVTPVGPTTPDHPVTPVEPTAPVQPVTPVEPVTPDHPVTPVEPTQPQLPLAIHASLLNDTGASSVDNYTNDATVLITGVASGARWQYSVDGGHSWIDGQGDRIAKESFGGDGAKSLLVHQLNDAGIPGANSELTFVLDTTATTLSSKLSTVQNGMRWGGNGVLTVDNLEAGAHWQYAMGNMGAPVWHDVSGGFKDGLDFDSANTVLLRQVDLAGNVSLYERVWATVASDSNSGYVRSADYFTIQSLGGSGKYSTDGGDTWSDFSEGKIYGDQISAQNGLHTMIVRSDIDPNAISETRVDFTLDKEGLRPDVHLKTDSGPDATDRITNDSTLVIDGLKDGNTWKYSVDGGASWKAGGADHQIAASEFGFNDGVKNAQVVQTSVEGKDSAIRTFEFTHASNTVSVAGVGTGGTPLPFIFTEGTDKLVVKPENRAFYLTNYNWNEGDVIDLSEVLHVPENGKIEDYISVGRLEDYDRVMVTINAGGLDSKNHDNLTLEIYPEGHRIMPVFIIYDGGEKVI
ncbi:type I secretion C-terminal target domain-containing protein [Roseateles aquatilis]|uniref:type I secretion C-terminal target domain-containing protein n=1 Tax=Roseateles aquatilis TaxID=431061 RepID=UPI0011324702|nr:type I secretion C-terminal target domain-containing protein [Roseateles aquatilis]